MLFLKKVRWDVLAISAFIVVLASLFWTQSRYPELDQKAMMSGNVDVVTTITFRQIIEFDPTTTDYWARVAYTTVNWANENKKGG